MRLKVIVTLLSISGGIICAQALQCQYCRGNACNQNNVPRLDCDNQVNTLPYNFQVNSNFENSIKACLELEYTKGLRRIPIRQCLLLSSENNVCDEIQFSLPSSVKLEKCHVRHKRDSEDDLTLVLDNSPSTTVLEDATTASSTTDSVTSVTTGSPVPTPDESPEARTVVEAIAVATEAETLSNEIPNAIETVTEMTTVMVLATTEELIEPSNAPVTQETKVMKVTKAAAAIEPSIALVTENIKISAPIAPVTERTTIVESPKTAAIIATASTTTTKVQTTTYPSHVAGVKHGITTSTMMTTTPAGSSRTFFSLITLLFTILIHVL